MLEDYTARKFVEWLESVVAEDYIEKTIIQRPDQADKVVRIFKIQKMVDDFLEENRTYALIIRGSHFIIFDRKTGRDIIRLKWTEDDKTDVQAKAEDILAMLNNNMLEVEL